MAKKPVNKTKKTDPDKKARVHKELEGFEIKVNPLGEITSNYSIEDINHFLNRHVRDKKLVNRDGQFGEKDDEELPLEDGAQEPEETDEDFMRRTSREAKKKGVKGESDAAADAEADLKRELPEE